MENQENILFSTAYLPPVIYFANALKCKTIIIEADENFPKQTFRNRMQILGPNGKQTLSIPIVKAENHKQKTKDVRISYETPWQKIHWKSIETAYNSSPFFLYYRDYFAVFYEKEYDNLLEYNTSILKLCFKCLKLNCSIEFTETFEKSFNGVDLREKINSDSKNLSEEFKLYFPPYIQVFSDKHGFHPNLSIIDLLFNLGPDAIIYIKDLQNLSNNQLFLSSNF